MSVPAISHPGAFEPDTDPEALTIHQKSYEVVNGVPLQLHIPTLTHQRILTNLIVAFGDHLSRKPIGEVISRPSLVFDADNAVVPDLVYMSLERRDRIVSGERLVGAPEIAVEVLSLDSVNDVFDYRIKRQLYGERGVRECWIIDPQGRMIDVYHMGDELFCTVETYANLDPVTSPFLPGFKVTANAIFKNC